MRALINGLTNVLFSYFMFISFLIFCVYVYMNWATPFVWIFFVGLGVWAYYALKSYFTFDPKPCYDPNEVKTEQEMRWAEEDRLNPPPPLDLNGLQNYLDQNQYRD